MPASNPPVINTAFIVYVALQDMANPGSYKASPTLAAGDVKVSIDGGAFNNLGTLPAVTPAAGIAVKVTMANTEMNGDNIFIQFIDQTNPKEWADYAFNVQTVAAIWLTPTTAGRTLDVSAGGEAGLDWANVGSPTTTVDLSGTTIKTSQVVASVTGAVGSVTGAVGSVTGAVGSVTARVTANADQWAGGTIPAPSVTGVPLIDLKYILGTVLTETAGQIAAGFKKFFNIAVPVHTVGSVDQTGDAFARLGAPAGASVSADVAAIKTDTGTTIPGRLPAALVSGRMDASVGAMAGDVLTAAAMAADAGAEIADAVWDEALAGHAGAGSAGAALSAAGTAGDPWSTLIPGAYGAGTAGKIVGDNVNATISSRAAASDLVTAQADLDDIQTRLPAALVSGRIDASVGAMAANVLTATAINADAITAAKIADGAIDAATFAAGAINAAAIAADAITAAKVADGAIDAATFAAGAINAAAIAADAITAAKVADGTIDTATFAAGTTIPRVTLADTLTTYTGNTPQTGDSFARIGVAGAGLTNIDLPNQIFDLVGNITGNLSGSVGSVTGAVGSVTGAVGSVTGNVGGNVTGSVGSVLADVGITQTGADKVWASAARTLTSFGTLVADIWASATRTLTSFGTLAADAADKLLGRNLAGGSDGGRTVQDGLRLLRNKRSIAAGTLTVTAEDDATPAWTAAIGTAATNPIQSVDPT